MADTQQEFTSSDSYSSYTTVDSISIFGDEDDLWGITEFTLEKLQDPDFAVKFDAEELGGTTLRVDQLSIEVFYELPNTAFNPADVPPWYDEELQSGAIIKDASGNNVYVVCGRDGLIRRSSDGNTWTEVESGVADTLRDIKATQSGAVAVGDNGAVVKTTDSLTFARELSESIESFNSIAYNSNDGSVVVVGQGGVIKTQDLNAVTWDSVRK